MGLFRQSVAEAKALKDAVDGAVASVDKLGIAVVGVIGPFNVLTGRFEEAADVVASATIGSGGGSGDGGIQVGDLSIGDPNRVSSHSVGGSGGGMGSGGNRWHAIHDAHRGFTGRTTGINAAGGNAAGAGSGKALQVLESIDSGVRQLNAHARDDRGTGARRKRLL